MTTTTRTKRDWTHLEERVVSDAGRVNISSGIIRGAKILGFSSRNGRNYDRNAVERAVQFYEGIVVNYDHPPRGNRNYERGIDDRAGWLQNVRLEKDGLFGDLHLFMSDPRASKVLEAASKRPRAIGLSHDAEGKVERRNGKQTVVEIFEVRAVDLVGDPASTQGLFESRGSMRLREMEQKSPRDNAIAQVRVAMAEVGEILSQKSADEALPQVVKILKTAAAALEEFTDDTPGDDSAIPESYQRRDPKTFAQSLR